MGESATVTLAVTLFFLCIFQAVGINRFGRVMLAALAIYWLTIAYAGHIWHWSGR